MIEIIPYQSRWPEEFQQLSSDIQNALGKFALRVDHIGSTSVPNLASKDIIDIQMTVLDFEAIDEIAGLLQPLGYVFRPNYKSDHRPPEAIGPDADWEKRYFSRPPDLRTVHLHVRALGRANQRYALLFRDYLRAHPMSAAAYAELKRQLAQYHGHESDVYSDIKDPACDIIMAAAESWITAFVWQP